MHQNRGCFVNHGSVRLPLGAPAGAPAPVQIGSFRVPPGGAAPLVLRSPQTEALQQQTLPAQLSTGHVSPRSGAANIVSLSGSRAYGPQPPSIDCSISDVPVRRFSSAELRFNTPKPGCVVREEVRPQAMTTSASSASPVGVVPSPGIHEARCATSTEPSEQFSRTGQAAATASEHARRQIILRESRSGECSQTSGVLSAQSDATRVAATGIPNGSVAAKSQQSARAEVLTALDLQKECDTAGLRVQRMRSEPPWPATQSLGQRQHGERVACASRERQPSSSSPQLRPATARCQMSSEHLATARSKSADNSCPRRNLRGDGDTSLPRSPSASSSKDNCTPEDRRMKESDTDVPSPGTSTQMEKGTRRPKRRSIIESTSAQMQRRAEREANAPRTSLSKDKMMEEIRECTFSPDVSRSRASRRSFSNSSHRKARMALERQSLKEELQRWAQKQSKLLVQLAKIREKHQAKLIQAPQNARLAEQMWQREAQLYLRGLEEIDSRAGPALDMLRMMDNADDIVARSGLIVNLSAAAAAGGLPSLRSGPAEFAGGDSVSSVWSEAWFPQRQRSDDKLRPAGGLSARERRRGSPGQRGDGPGSRARVSR